MGNLPDGWYKTTWIDGAVDYEHVVNGFCGHGEGLSAEEAMGWGYTFEPAVVGLKEEYDDELVKAYNLGFAHGINYRDEEDE